jgi:multidrug efflux pump subunit AcrA (membrane-fusion protein)
MKMSKKGNKSKKKKKTTIILLVIIVIFLGALFSYKFFISGNKDEYSYESLKEQGLISETLTEARFETIKEQYRDDPEQLLDILENMSTNGSDSFNGNRRGMMNPISSIVDTDMDEDFESVYLVYPVSENESETAEYISITGTLEVETREVISKISADIEEVFVKEGDYVTEDSTIAILDDTEYQINYINALNDYENSWDSSASERKLLELKLLQAEKNLGYAVIKSPINGIISSVNVNEGEMISNESAAVSIVDYENVYVSGVIDEIDMSKIYDEMKAVISFPNYDVEITGSIYFISPVAESSGGVVVVPIEIELDENPYEKGIISGVSCDVNLIVKDFIDGNIVPSNTVYEDEEGSYVLKQADDSESPEKVYVEVGESTEDNVQILSGVELGDVLVIQPDMKEILRLNDSPHMSHGMIITLN